MSDLSESPRADLAISPGIRFVPISERVRLERAAEQQDWLSVRLGPFGPSVRGQLRNVVEDGIERALRRRGAAPPGIASDTPLFEVLHDMVFRAGQVGVRGLALAFDSLFGIVGPSGAVGDEDSATLRELSRASQKLSLCLWFTPADASLPAYEAPKPLRQLLAPQNVRIPAVPPAQQADKPNSASTVSPPIARSTQAAGLLSLPPRATLKKLAEQLMEAEGPKPLREVESLFVTHYVPLSLAVAAGNAPREVVRAVTGFASSFEKSYKDAFSALRVTGKRPTMTADIPQLASKWTRVHGARRSSLLLVDSLRYDLWTLLEPQLIERLKGTAVLAERTLVWAALPTTTPVQLQLLARGPRALRSLDSLAPSSDRLTTPRGKNANMIRRLRLSGREIYKLDAIRADISGHGPAALERLQQLAGALLDPVERFARASSPRTLLVLFGDHGFVLPPPPTDTGPGHWGGASPEEVLVPVTAWLIGNVH